jgi:hypothetical protein
MRLEIASIDKARPTYPIGETAHQRAKRLITAALEQAGETGVAKAEFFSVTKATAQAIDAALVALRGEGS